MPAGWPDWWEWELELSGHLLARMEDRGFSETDLRSMFVRAVLLIPYRIPDRWVVSTRHQDRRWLVVLELDVVRLALVVITTYPAS